jgi:NAD(P)-dependent dehydrogenase (short-subunit alcohol dehydrogenase family)
MRPVNQQTILITGATDGLGRALAGELAAKGATLLLHGRDDDRGHQTIAEIRSATGNESLHWLRADLASLSEVRALANQVGEDVDPLDALVNNAGSAACREPKRLLSIGLMTRMELHVARTR